MSAATGSNWTAADSLFRTLADCGVDIVFANPGTTEMPLVAAFDTCGRPIRAVLALQENVCSAAADAYWRTSGRTAATLLHLGPGLTNAAANLHNARRARSGIVNIVGDHPSRHLSVNSPLQTPLLSLCRDLSDWTEIASDPVGQGRVARRAAEIAAAGKVVSVIVPHDVQLAQGDEPVDHAWNPPRRGQSRTVQDVASALARAKHPAILLGGSALRANGLSQGQALASRANAVLYCETLFASMDRGGDLPRPKRIPYFPEQAVELLKGHDLIVLVDADEPVAFFAYPGIPSRLLSPACEVLTLASPDEDAVGALEALLEQWPAPDKGARADSATDPSAAPRTQASKQRTGPLDAQSLSEIVAMKIPENAVVVDESITTGFAFFEASAGSKRFQHLGLTGGAIGWGPGASVGAALGSGGLVINLQADGSGLYLPQALWTQARYRLPVVTVVCRNNRYTILGVELERAGVNEPGQNAASMCDIAGIDWVALAAGFGVGAVAVKTVDDLMAALDSAIASGGPFLIEAWI